jgi:SHS2 domain-containing protein
MNKSYELFEHTADIGIKVSGQELSQLFINAAVAVFDIMAEAKGEPVAVTKTFQIDLETDDLDELLVTWLNELLSLSSAKGVIFHSFNVRRIDERHLSALAGAGASSAHVIKTEIKAATYHELAITKGESGWQARIILDV